MLVQIFASSACTGRGLHDLGAEDLEQLGRPRARALADAADDAGQRGDLLEEVVLGDPLGHVRDEQVLADAEAAPLLDVAGHPVGRARARRSSAGSASGPRAAPAAGRRPRRGSARCRSRCGRSAGVPSVSTMWSALGGVLHRARSSSQPVALRARARAAPGCRSPRTASARPRSGRARACSRSTPITSSPRSANDSASGRPTRPRPTTATLAAMRRQSTSGAYARQVLARERQHEARVVVEVARQQPARLLRDPVDPLEPALLHPRAAPCETRPAWKSKAAPTPHITGTSSRSRMRAIHFSCLGTPMPDPEHVRARLVDLLDERVLLLVGRAAGTAASSRRRS